MGAYVIDLAENKIVIEDSKLYVFPQTNATRIQVYTTDGKLNDEIELHQTGDVDAFGIEKPKGYKNRIVPNGDGLDVLNGP